MWGTEGSQMSGVMRKAMVYLGLSDDDYQEYSGNDDRVTVAAPRAGADYSRGTSSIRPLAPEGSTAPVAPIQRQSPATPRFERKPTEPVRVQIVEPIEFGDAQQVGDHLREGNPVCVVLSDVEPDLARRLIDFCSGSTYVLSGSMERIGKNVFLLAPSGVTASEEERQRLVERGLAAR